MALPDLNSPEAQAAVQAEAERKRQQEAAANAPTGVNTPVADTTGDIASGMVNAVDDFFSAEHVNGADDNGWGEAGTAAAGYNAGAVQKGLSDQAASKGTGNNLFAGSAAQGSDALGFAGGEANNLIGQASAVGQRRAPATNWAGADQYASKADSARNTANALVNQAGSSTQQDAQLAALNQFANSGPGASAAQAQLAAAGDSAQRSALSMARSGRGAGDSASALRDATFSNAATQATTGQNMAQLRAQEEATFRQQQLQALDAAMGGAGAIRGADTAAAQVAQGTRSQDLQAQGQAADQSKFNTTTQQNQTQINDAAKNNLLNTSLGFLGEGNQTNLGFQQLGQQSLLGFEQLGAQQQIDNAQLGQNALNAQADYDLQQQQMELDAAKANQQADLEKDSGVSGMIGAAAGVLGLSDERSKAEIERLTSANDALSAALGVDGGAALDTIGNAPASTYRYKNPDQPGAAPGRQASSMAQDLERGPYGGDVVDETPQGKMVDYEQVMKITPGAVTELNQKVEALERALGKRRAA
jgi:hypothetical protein